MSSPETAAGADRHAVLLVGGLDPSGGAGLLTDATVVRRIGLHPVLAATAIAVQNTTRVAHRYDLPARLVREQLNVTAEEFSLGAAKAGILPTVEIVETVAEWLSARPRLPLVLDPVLRATSGGELVDAASMQAIVRVLFPRSRLITPNLEETAAFTGRVIQDRDDVAKAAEALLEMGPEWVLIKGGPSSRDDASDYLASARGGAWLVAPKHTHDDTRGTGCALASAIAAYLARGTPLPEAARSAKTFVTAAIDAGYRSGQGRFLRS